MYLAIFSYKNVPTHYCGPFISEARAHEYATIWRRAFSSTIDGHSIVPLTVPHNEWNMGLAMAKSETKRIGD